MNLAERQLEMKRRISDPARKANLKKASSRLHPATIKYQERVGVALEKADKKRQDSESFNAKNYDNLTSEQRLKILTDWSCVLIEPVTFEVLQERRRSFDAIKNKKFPLSFIDNTILIKTKRVPYPCWVCRARNAQHRHHVVLLKNGGSVASKSNIVLLCESCHADIHPWMVLNPIKPVTYAEFELVRAQREASLVLERAARGRFRDAEQVDAILTEYVRRVFNSLTKNSAL